MMEKSALIDGIYRYELVRRWDSTKFLLGWVCLNPSTADDEEDDASLRKMMAISRQLGYGGVKVWNVFAFRAKVPKAMWDAAAAGVNIVGPRNLDVIESGLPTVDSVVFGWGVLPLKADAACRNIVAVVSRSKAHAAIVGRTGGGYPRHPLYLAYAKVKVSPATECAHVRRLAQP